MIIILGLGFVGVLGLWMIVIEAFDRLEEIDRRKEQEKRPKIMDRLVKYQARNY
jgi:hypothetical protein